MQLDRLTIHYFYTCYTVDDQYCRHFSTEDITEEFTDPSDILYMTDFYYHPSPLWFLVETYAHNSKDLVSINQTGKYGLKYRLWDCGEILEEYPMREDYDDSSVLFKGL